MTLTQNMQLPEDDSPIQSTTNSSSTNLDQTEESTPSPKKSPALPEKIMVPREWRHSANYPNDFIIENTSDRMQTKKSLRKQTLVGLVSQMEQKKVDEAFKDDC